MQLLPLFIIGATVTFGVGCFWIDFYRNRNKITTKPNPSADLSHCYEGLGYLDGENTSPVVNHTSRVASEASTGIGHCVEAIAHTLSHH